MNTEYPDVVMDLAHIGISASTLRRSTEGCVLHALPGMVGMLKLASLLSRNCLPANLHLGTERSAGFALGDLQEMAILFHHGILFLWPYWEMAILFFEMFMEMGDKVMKNSCHRIRPKRQLWQELEQF